MGKSAEVYPLYETITLGKDGIQGRKGDWILILGGRENIMIEV